MNTETDKVIHVQRGNKSWKLHVIVSMLVLSAVGHKFKPWSGQTKDFKIGICWFSDQHAALRNNSKDWLALNQINVYEQSDMDC